MKIFIPIFIALTSIWDSTPQQIRNQINSKILAIPADKPEVKSVADIKTTTGEALRVYTPNKEGDLPIIFLIHGGGWVGGSIETHDNLARYLSKEVQAVVFSVEYSNSPEAKFPLPLEQCYNALVWIAAHAKEYHGDPKRIAVVGDSAGGNLAAAICLLARDRKGPSIDLQVLINPAPDLTMGIEPIGDDLDDMRWFAKQYVKDAHDLKNPYASPILGNLANLPPALILLAEKDIIRQEGQSYADRLILAKVPTNVFIQWNVDHLAGNAARANVVAKESLEVAAAVLRGAFGRLANSNFERRESSHG